MHWPASRSPLSVTTAADVPPVPAPKGAMPQKLSTFRRPAEQQQNFREVIDTLSHRLAEMGLPEEPNHRVGEFELLRHGRTGVHLSKFKGTGVEFFEPSGDAAHKLEQLTAWTMKDLSVQAFVEEHLDGLFADGRRPVIEIWYSEARDPVKHKRLHKDVGEPIFTSLHYDTDRPTDGVEFTVNDASVAKVLDRNPNNLPASIIATLRTEQQSLPPADKIYESTIDPEGGILFNNILLSHSTPGPKSRAIDPLVLKNRLPGFFERQGQNAKQAYESCLRLRQVRLTDGLSLAQSKFLYESPVARVL
ncbi:hypothetical protein GCM10023165_16360 [Variovorax defluvii]|uniref:TauD/TfdA-like domain-containing protein n=1 Tax=Variovorax defluvii TaxID=913761 RepID=A0ABP8HDR0_9BURK